MLTYAFGPFVLDPAERRLARAGRPLAVPRKAWQILLLLAEAGGRLVPHETFRTTLWPNVVVEDRTLTVHMSTLRKALGTDPTADIIETVAGAGYRLAVPVRALSKADLPPRTASGPPMADARLLAVRTFSTGDLAEADTYLGVGIADAVTTVLGTLPGLTVSPVGAVEDLAGARTLGLAHMLEGAVRRDAEKLHVSARLIDVASGRTEWSERFEQSHIDGAALEDAIATKVATSLPQGLAQGSATDHGLHSYRPQATEAYFLQLQARAHLKPFTRLPLLKALTLFEQALVLDPDYAMAHAGLGSAYLLMASTAMLRPLQVDEAMPMARRAAERALALDESLAEAWAVLGRVKMEHDWDWEGAEADLAHAIALNPSSVEALATFGQFLSAMGRHDEAIEAMERARALDPRRVETLQHLGIAYWMAGKADRALGVVTDSLALAPDSVRGQYGRMMILDQLGRHDEAMTERLSTLRGLSVAQGLAEHVEMLLRSKGWRDAMHVWIGLLERTNRWEGAAMQWMAVGEPERALDALEHCIKAHTTYLCFTAQNPYFHPLHGEPRFQRILATLKLDGRTIAPT
ncbi:MAG: winged helix-turn-helix domain-containing tetratricopeptide repeat protein [Reyranella sp.]